MSFDAEGPRRGGEPFFLVPTPVLVFAGLFVAIHGALALLPATWRFAVENSGALWPRLFASEHWQDVAIGSAQLVAHGFLHAGWEHVLINVALLLAAAGQVNRASGPWGLWILFLICVAAGGLAHLAFYWGSDARVIGASGGAGGLLAAALRYRVRDVYEGERAAPISRQPVLGFTIFWIGLNAALYALDRLAIVPTDFAAIAHIGGYLAGLALAPYFARPQRPRLRAL